MLRSVHTIRFVASKVSDLKRQRQTKRGREVLLLALSLTPPVKGLRLSDVIPIEK
jgi:hypothetical protein